MNERRSLDRIKSMVQKSRYYYYYLANVINKLIVAARSNGEWVWTTYIPNVIREQ